MLTPIFRNVQVCQVLMWTPFKMASSRAWSPATSDFNSPRGKFQTSSQLSQNFTSHQNCIENIWGQFFFFFKSTGYGVNRPVAQHVFNSSHCDLSTSASVPFSKDQRWRNYAGKLREGITSCLYFTQGKPRSRE